MPWAGVLEAARAMEPCERVLAPSALVKDVLRMLRWLPAARLSSSSRACWAQSPSFLASVHDVYSTCSGPQHQEQTQGAACTRCQKRVASAAVAAQPLQDSSM